MFIRILFACLICCLGSVLAKAQAAYPQAGVGIAGVTVGKSSLTDVVAFYGEDYKLIVHKKYSYEARYPNGLAFWFCRDDRARTIFSLRVSSPYLGITDKGVAVGESTLADVFRLYGEAEPLTTSDNKTWFFEYVGIQFHVRFDSWEDDDNKELFLQRKITQIEIEPVNKSGNACD